MFILFQLWMVVGAIGQLGRSARTAVVEENKVKLALVIILCLQMEEKTALERTRIHGDVIRRIAVSQLFELIVATKQNKKKNTQPKIIAQLTIKQSKQQEKYVLPLTGLKVKIIRKN